MELFMMETKSKLLAEQKQAQKVKNHKICVYVSTFCALCAILALILCVIYIPSPNNESNNDDKNNKSQNYGNYPKLVGDGNVLRDDLTYSQLMGTSSAPSSYVSYTSMELPSNAAQPDFEFAGTFTITPSQGSYQEVVDWYNYNNPRRRTLPTFSTDIIQDGSHLIPVIRYNQRTSHQYWEYIFSAGRVWKEDDDQGWMRAALPFTLTQKNAQCAHNGVFMFLFNNNNGGSISNVWYQITQETCMYFKGNFWGRISNTNYNYNQFIDNNINPDTVKSEYQFEVDNRIPTAPLSDLSTRFGDDIWFPEHITATGVYYNGIHWVGDYYTRSGSYPYPSSLIVPSYSTAKSVFLGYAAMYLEEEYGNFFNDILDIGYSGPGSNRWSDVTNDNCLDMSTGNYYDSSWMVDESLIDVENQFFLPETHSSKYSHSTTYYQRRVNPNNAWVYHSSDHYLCGFGAKRFLRSKSGNNNADIYNEIYENVYKKLKCSDVLRESKRTYDSEYQPFSSHGLFFTRDDIVKLSNFINIDYGMIDGQQILNLNQVQSTLQLTNDKGLNIGNADDVQNNQWFYNNGFWSGRKLWTRKQCPVDIPLMRGYGGIRVVLLPNGMTYYYFGDHNEGDWLEAADEANNILPFC